MAKDLKYGTEARAQILEGANKLANAVRATLGPRGRNVMIDKGPYTMPRITKDGVTVAREISLKDKFQNMGAQTLREVASRACDKAGDGTSTATVLAQAIFNEGSKAVAAGMNPVDIKRGIDQAVEIVIEAIKASSRPVADKVEWIQVATLSANGDKEIGENIANALEAVGREGIVTIEENKGFGFSMEVVEGLLINRGYLSPYFINREDKPIVEFKNPLILMLEDKLEKLEPIIPLLEMAMKNGRPLLIIAEDVIGEAFTLLVMNKVRANPPLQVCAIRSPSHGAHRKEFMDDLSVIVGGQYINDVLGIRLENATNSVFGQATKIIITKDDTTIVGGSGDKAAIESRTNQIRALVDEAPNDAVLGPLKQRLAKFTGGVAVIKVGGATEIEVKERWDRTEDALHATRAAIEEGIVSGGGTALLLASKKLEGIKGVNDDQTVGIAILRKAIQQPLKQIAENAGQDGVLVAGKVMDGNPSVQNFGFDAQSLTYKDLLADGIIDPTKVVRSALENAASVAGLLITTEVLITDIVEEKK